MPSPSFTINTAKADALGYVSASYASKSAYTGNPASPNTIAIYPSTLTTVNPVILTCGNSHTTGGNFYARRTYMLLDVTGINKGDTINSATLNCDLQAQNYWAGATTKSVGAFMWIAGSASPSASQSVTPNTGAAAPTANQFLTSNTSKWKSVWTGLTLTTTSADATHSWDYTSHVQNLVDSYYFNPQKILVRFTANNVTYTQASSGTFLKTSMDRGGNNTYLAVDYTAAPPAGSDFVPQIIFS
jgi:hypothetical protein